MLGVFRSRLQRDAPAVYDPTSVYVNDMSNMFSVPFSELHSSQAAPPAQQPQEPGSARTRSSLQHARHSLRASLPNRPRLSRDSFSLPGHQPFRTLLFGAHSSRLFPNRFRREGREEPLSYESMLALDEMNPRRAVKLQVLDALQTARKCEGEDCRICMEPWRPDKQHVRLPCGHDFCVTCSRSWLEFNSSCPVCRWSFPDCDTVIMHPAPCYGQGYLS